MFVPVQNAVGQLTAPISSVANIISVDPGLIALLADKLGYNGTDHTYLLVGEAPLCEMLKVIEVNAASIVVTRGQDVTVPLDFTAGTPLRYVLAASAVADMVQAIAGAPVQIDANYPLSVETAGEGEYTISIENLQLVSAEDSISITGSYPLIEIDVNPQYLGCCGSNDSGGGPM